MNPATKVLFNQYNLDHLYTGVTAFTTRTGSIIISIDTREKNWQTILKYVIAHEYHHSVWTSRNFKRKDFSVIEYLVFEGRADYFASKIFPDIKVPWTKNLNPVKEKEAWKILRDKLQLRDDNLDKILYGDGKIPYGSVYSVGYSIVSNFMMNNPQVSIMELTDMDPQGILDRSGYLGYIDSIK